MSLLLTAAAACLQAGVYLAADGVGAVEPFRYVREYIEGVVITGIVVGVFLFIPIAGLLATAWARTRPGPRVVRATRVLLQCSLITLLPVFANRLAVALVQMRNPAFGITYEAKPAWINSPVLDMIVNPLVLIGAGVGALLVVWLERTVRNPQSAFDASANVR